MKYALASPFLVRMAGFTFRHLERLRFVKSKAALDALLDGRDRERASARAVVAALDAVRYDSAPEARDRSAYNRIRRSARKVRDHALEPRGPLPAAAAKEIARVFSAVAPSIDGWLADIAAIEPLEERYRGVFASELEEMRLALHAIYRDNPRLLESVFLESASSLSGVRGMLEGGERNSRAKARERTAVMYLQRFCAKNDTNSMCGPVGLAFLGEGRRTEVVIEDEIAARKTYFSHWAADVLLDALLGRSGARGQLPIRTNPTMRADGDRMTWGVFEHDSMHFFRRKYLRASMSEVMREVVDALPRPRPADDLVRDLAGRTSMELDDARDVVEQLSDARLLVSAPRLPTGVFEPLVAVRRAIERLEDVDVADSRAILDALEANVARFASSGLEGRIAAQADLEAHFEDVTGVSPRRGEGEHYADRGLLHEDCHARVRADIEPRERSELERTVGALAGVQALALARTRARVLAWFRRTFGEGAAVAVTEVSRRFDEERPDTAEASSPEVDEVDRLLARARGLVERALDEVNEGVARVDLEDLLSIVDRAPSAERPAYASVDLMMCRAGGPVRWVIGELHGMFLLPTFWFDVVPAPERERALASMRDILRRLARGRPTAEGLFTHTQATDRHFPIASFDMSVIGSSARPPSDVFDFGVLDVRADRDGIHFLRGAEEIVPLLGYRNWHPFLLYTTPLICMQDDYAGRFPAPELLPPAVVEGDAPRMCLGNVVFRRASWTRTATFVAEALGGLDDAALLHDAELLRRRIGCPREVFVSIHGEPKPLFLDFSSYFLVEAFGRLVRGGDPARTVRFSEMLPGPNDLFLEGSDGPRTFELRMGIYRDA